MSRLLLLANSFKEGGRCLAGVNIETGVWERPVSPSAKGAWATDAVQHLKVFDLVEYSVSQTCATKHHPEDMLSLEPPRKIEHLNRKDIIGWCNHLREPDTGMLWGVGSSIPEEQIEKHPLKHSLYAFVTGELCVYNDATGTRWKCSFEAEGNLYYMSLTDCDAIQKLAAHKVSRCTIRSQVMVCVSITELYEKTCAYHKVVATIRTVPCGG
ncbi:MAG: dual OB domain-containing protein [Armatimonadota bacterium]